MSLNVETILSEAPATRAAELRMFFESLKLPEGRLDARTLVRITDAVAARADLFEDLLVDDEVNRWWFQLWVTESYESPSTDLGARTVIGLARSRWLIRGLYGHCRSTLTRRTEPRTTSASVITITSPATTVRSARSTCMT